MIKYDGLSKAEVLVELFNHALPKDSLKAMIISMGSSEMTLIEAENLLKQSTSFDYYRNRCLKIDLSGDEEFDEYLYDREYGIGSAQNAIIDGLVKKKHEENRLNHKVVIKENLNVESEEGVTVEHSSKVVKGSQEAELDKEIESLFKNNLNLEHRADEGIELLELISIQDFMKRTETVTSRNGILIRRGQFGYNKRLKEIYIYDYIHLVNEINQFIISYNKSGQLDSECLKNAYFKIGRIKNKRILSYCPNYDKVFDQLSKEVQKFKKTTKEAPKTIQ